MRMIGYTTSMSIRNCVRLTRLRRRLSVTELHRRTGLTRQTIYAIERDNGYTPKADVMFRLSQALNEDVATLFWSEPERPRVVEVA
jgi:DNA-binding XRE family transcriptional regulator